MKLNFFKRQFALKGKNIFGVIGMGGAMGMLLLSLVVAGRFLYTHLGWSFIILSFCPFMIYYFYLEARDREEFKAWGIGIFILACACTFMIFDSHGKAEVMIDKLLLKGHQTTEQVWVEDQESDTQGTIPAHYETQYEFVPNKGESEFLNSAIGWFTFLFPIIILIINYQLLKRLKNTLLKKRI